MYCLYCLGVQAYVVKLEREAEDDIQNSQDSGDLGAGQGGEASAQGLTADFNGNNNFLFLALEG